MVKKLLFLHLFLYYDIKNNMRIKLYIILAIFAFTSIQTHAQEFKGGILGGFTTSQINGDGFGGFNKFGATAGFFVEREFSKKKQGVFEIRYTQKGSADGIPNVKINVGYIELPILYRYITPYKIGLKAGIAPAIKIFETTEVSFIVNQTSDYWIWDLPIHMGFDYELSKKILFDVRYSFSTFPVSWHYYNWCVYFAFHYYLKQ